MESLKDFLAGLWVIGQLALCSIPWIILGMLLPEPYWHGVVLVVLSVLLLSLGGSYIRKG